MASRPALIPAKHVLAAASALAILSTLASYQLLRDTAPSRYLELAAMNGAYWLAWAAIAPLIVALVCRYPVRRSAWRKPLAIHAVAAIALSQLHTAALEILRHYIAIYQHRPFRAPLSSRMRQTMLQAIDWSMMTYWTIAGVALAIIYYREAQQRTVAAAQLQTRLVESRLEVLQSRLQPHFLFNTLHAISSLMHVNVRQADSMLGRLADLLRMALDHRGARDVPLKEELEFLHKYLEIEEARLGPRLTVSERIADETLDASVPWMLLQPIVENAIKHGVSPRRGGGTVDLRAQRDGEWLVLLVSDEGRGPAALTSPASRNGVGLSTTLARLQHQFGDRHRLEFLPGPRGMTVRIALPWTLHESSDVKSEWPHPEEVR